MYILLIILTMFTSHAYAADTKVSDLPSIGTTPADADELYINDGGTSKKVLYSDLMSGEATTAAALAANGGNCAAGEYALGVDAAAAVESCTDATTEINAEIGNVLDGTDTFTDFTGRVIDSDNYVANSVDDDAIDFTDFTCVDLTMTDCGSIVVDGTMTLSSGSIVDSTGSISFGNESLVTTGASSFPGGITGDITGDLVCTDCLNATEIEDIYLLNNANEATTFDLSVGSLIASGSGTFPLGLILNDETTGNMIVSDGTSFYAVNPSGDVDVDSAGAFTIQDNVTTTGWVLGTASATAFTSGSFVSTSGTITFNEGTVDFNATTDEYVLAYDTATSRWRGVVAGAGAGDLLANATVPMTADWSMGSFNIDANSFSGSAGTWGTTTISDATIINSTGSISFGDENLVTTGDSTFSSRLTTISLLVTSSSTLEGYVFIGDIDDNYLMPLADGNAGEAMVANGAGAISFEDAYLKNDADDVTSGMLYATGGFTSSIGTITFGSYTVNFGDNPADNYVLTLDAATKTWKGEAAGAGAGDLLADGTVPMTADWSMGAFDIDANSFSGSAGTWGDINISTGSITADGGTISFGNENLVTSGAVTFGDVTSSGFIGDLTGNADTATDAAAHIADNSQAHSDYFLNTSDTNTGLGTFNGGLLTTGSMTIDSDTSGIYFGDGQDSSIYFDGTELNISTLGGATISLMDGNVGVGTASPGQLLVVETGAEATGGYMGVRLGSDNRFIKIGNTGEDLSQILVDDNDTIVFGQEDSFATDGSTITELMRIEREGGTDRTLVGIGNNNPAYELDVVGDVNITEELFVTQDVTVTGSVITSSSITIDADDKALYLGADQDASIYWDSTSDSSVYLDSDFSVLGGLFVASTSTTYFLGNSIILTSPDLSCSMCNVDNSDTWTCADVTCPPIP